MCNLIHIYTHIHTYAHIRGRISLLDKLGRPLPKTRRSNRYGVCHKCGDLHMNLSRHSRGRNRMPLEIVPSHLNGLAGEPSARCPASQIFSQQDIEPCPRPLQRQVAENRRHGTHVRCPRRDNPRQDIPLFGKTGLAGVPTPFACSPRHTLLIFGQAHNALWVAPAGGP